LRVAHATPGHIWSWSLRIVTVFFPMWITPAVFMLRDHVPLVSLAARLVFHMLGPLPQWAMG
jgi:hypothetical protein